MNITLQIPPSTEYCLFWFWTDWWPLCMTKIEWSGWVQAIGAIAAILAGASAVWWQVKRQAESNRRAALAEEVRRLKVVGAALFHCRVVVETVQDEPNFPAKETLLDLRAQLSELRAIPPFDFPDWKALHGIVYAHGTLETHLSRILEADSHLTRRAFDDREKYLNVVLNGIEFAEQLVAEALIQRGSEPEPITMRMPDGREIWSLLHPKGFVKKDG